MLKLTNVALFAPLNCIIRTVSIPFDVDQSHVFYSSTGDDFTSMPLQTVPLKRGWSQGVERQGIRSFRPFDGPVQEPIDDEQLLDKLSVSAQF